MKQKREVKVGSVVIGGAAAISVQSMTNTKTDDVKATLNQINDLYQAGADLVRVSVPDEKSLSALWEIVKNSPLPVIADTHYSLDFAIKCVEAGAKKVRVNPGNTKNTGRLDDLVKACLERGAAIRIGVNSGSLGDEYKDLPKHEALVKCAYDYEKKFYDAGFLDTVLSVKSSDVLTTVRANRMLWEICQSPLHIGLTEAGTYENGVIKSTAALSALLLDGIGNTVRVSLTTPNLTDEIRVARKLLAFLGLRNDVVDVVACPTCARTEIDVAALAEQIERATFGIKKSIKIAVMGCAVNGIGECGDADLGVCGGKQKSLIISRGNILETVQNSDLLPVLMRRVKELIKE
jgi:(E)-4-hydroxy-3-methylbut-2-enyl-diphosphate synthase